MDLDWASNLFTPGFRFRIEVPIVACSYIEHAGFESGFGFKAVGSGFGFGFVWIRIQACWIRIRIRIRDARIRTSLAHMHLLSVCLLSVN